MTDKTGVIARALALLCLILSAAGCAREAPPASAAIGGIASAPPAAGERLVSMPRPPVLAARDAESLALARLNAVRTRWDDLYRRRDANLASIESLPFLQRTAEGRRVLAAEHPRAIARGMPAASCPITLTVTPPAGTGLDATVGEALSRCLAEVRADHPDCGCEVLAVNDFLTVPRGELNYAGGTTARLRVPALGIDDVLVAEETGDGALIRDLRGPVARLTRLPEDRVEVTLLRPRRTFAGRRIPVGYRRGRIAERIYATDPGGARMSLLIGIAPDELAEGAAAWLAWPAGS